MPLPKPRAEALAAQLDVGLDGVCLACLSFISAALDGGDEADVRRWTRRMTPSLWDDGLDRQILDAVGRASDEGVPDADVALEELNRIGPRSGVARAVVRRLAEELARWERRSRQAMLN